MSSVKWLFWLVVLLIAVLLVIHWPADERQSSLDAGAGLVRPNSAVPGETVPSSPLPALGRTAITPGVDFSPPPGNAAPMVSPVSPFVSPAQANTTGTISDWGRGVTDIAGAFWRAALAKIGISAPPPPSAPAQTIATSAASPITPTVPPQTATPGATANFETPPGVGSPRGGK